MATQLVHHRNQIVHIALNSAHVFVEVVDDLEGCLGLRNPQVFILFHDPMTLDKLLEVVLDFILVDRGCLPRMQGLIRWCSDVVLDQEHPG